MVPNGPKWSRMVPNGPEWSQDLSRQIEETENAIGALGKNKISLNTQLEDTKKLADGEARDRASILVKYNKKERS